MPFAWAMMGHFAIAVAADGAGSVAGSGASGAVSPRSSAGQLMSGRVQLDSGVAVTLGSVLASAGEGTIYEIADRPDWVAKIFHPDLHDLPGKRDKVAAMIASPPDGAVQSDGFVVLTWPLQMIEGAAGYVMPRIDTADAVEIHTVSNPSDRMHPLPAAPQWTPHATWLHLVNVAANLCLAVDTVHLVDAVIGDFQERNILVHDTTRVTLVDCDSMQFTDGAGRQLLCGVGRPEFTAPELAGVDLKSVARERPSDLFALAVHIHLLLMGGNHPFLRGEWTGGGEQPDALTLAKSGEWAGGPGSRLRTHPLAPPVTFLPPDIQSLFNRAFTAGVRDPDIRPSAAEWRTALLSIQVTSCPRGHQIPVKADPCPWCVIDTEQSRRKAQHARGASVGVAAQTVLRAEAPPRPAPAPAAAWQSSSGSATSRANNNGVVIALAVGAVALVGLLIAAIVHIAGGSGTNSAGSSRSGDGYYTYTTSPYPGTPTRTVDRSPPLGARECGSPIAGTYSQAAIGSDVTSCPFAMNVRAVVNEGRVEFPATIDVFSPVTNKHYDMFCAVEQVLTCRGGNNAVVYVY